jgi:coatomer subunit beta
MWTEFEWENRVNVNNSMSSVLDPCVFVYISHRGCFFRDPRDYLHHVMKSTNMSCLTPEGATSGECDFLSANMYARSLFGKYF